MPYLQGYDHDIFVSYAHGPVPMGHYAETVADPLSRWTQRLVDDLRDMIDFHLGTKDERRRVDIWMDPELEGHRPLTDNLKRKVERSALLLVVMSPFYLGSAWCGDEVGWFAAVLPERPDREGRLFVVRTCPTDEARWPRPLKDESGVALPGYSFYRPVRAGETCEPFGFPQPTPSDLEYRARLSRLAQEITKQLQRLSWLEEEKRQKAAPSLVDVPDSVGRRVFLGLMHDTLTDRGLRNELREALAARKITVLPPVAEDPTDQASLDRALEVYLPQSEAFVVVANEYGGAWPPGTEGGFVGYQLEQANGRKIPSYLWLQVPDIAAVPKEGYRRYLERIEQQATDKKLQIRHKTLGDFVGYVQERLNQKVPAPEVERLAVVCANRGKHEAEQKLLFDNVLALFEEDFVPSWIALPDPETGQIKLEKIKEALRQAGIIVIMCFDQEYEWALRFWSQLKSEKVMAPGGPTRIFLVGPKDLEKGDFNLPRFSKINALREDALARLREVMRKPAPLAA